MATATILIGNSDNKLTQEQWHDFVADVGKLIEETKHELFFFGAPAGHEKWQNACWVAFIPDDDLAAFRSRLTCIRRQFNQDSAAVLFGETEFI